MAWFTIEKEAYAVTFALRKYRNFVFAANVIVFYHNPLMYLSDYAPKSATLPRWSLGLQDFDLSWQYRRGSDNQAADCLSRLG